MSIASLTLSHCSALCFQGRINAALNLLSSNYSDPEAVTLEHNLKALAYIKGGKSLYAFNIILQLETVLARRLDSSKSRKERVLVFYDIFESLLTQASRDNHRELLSRLKISKKSLVHSKTLAAYLKEKLTRHYVRQSDKVSFVCVQDFLTINKEENNNNNNNWLPY